MGQALTVEATLKDQISESLKTISNGLKSLNTVLTQTSADGSSALDKLANASKQEAVAVDKSVAAHKEAAKATENHASKLGQAKEKVLGFADSLVSLATGGMLVGGATQAFEFLAEGVKDAMNEGQAAQQVMASLDATLKMTGKTTGVTSSMAESLAESLSTVTTFSAQTIESGESMMVTFDKVSKKTFPDAIKVSLDMAQKMGISVPSAARLLGRALNDPITGTTQLVRYGIQLSQTQKDQVKHFMAVNDIADAQNIILKALHGRFGDVAQAVGSTFSGKLQIVSNEFELMREKIGQALIPIMGHLLTLVQPLAGWFGENLPKAFNLLSSILGQYVVPITISFTSALAGVSNTVAASLTPAIQGAATLIGNFTSFITGASPAATALKVALAILTAAIIAYNVNAAITAITTKVQLIPTLWATVSAWAAEAIAIDAAAMPLAIIGGLIVGIILLFKHWYDTNSTFRNAINSLVHDVLGKLQQVLQALLPHIQQIGSQFMQFAKDVATRVQPILKNIVDFFTTHGPQMATALGDALKKVQGIWDAVWPVLYTVLKVIFTLIGGQIQSAMNIIFTVVKVVLDLLSGNWKQVFNDIKTFVSNEFGIIRGVFGGAIDFMVGKAKAILDKINEWKTPILIVAGILTAVFAPALISAGTQAAINGGKMAVNFIQDGIQAGKSMVLEMAANIKTMAANLVEMGANAIKAGASMAMNFVSSVRQAIAAAIEFAVTTLPAAIGSLIGYAAAGWAAAAATIAATWPILLIIAAIAALVAVVILVVTHWKQVSEFLQNVWSKVVDGVRAGITWLWDHLKAFGEFLQGIWAQVWNTVVNFIKDHWQLIISIVLGPLGIIISLVVTWGPKIMAAVSGPLNWIRNFVVAIWNFVVQFIGAILGIIGKIIGDVWDGISSKISFVLNFIKAIIQRDFAIAHAYIAAAMLIIHTVIKDAWDWISGKINDALEFIKGILKTDWDFISGVVTTVWNAIVDFLVGIWENIKSKVQAAIEFVKTVLETDWNYIHDTVSNVWNKISTFLSNIWDTIKTNVQTAITNLKTNLEDRWNQIKDTATNLWTTISTNVENAVHNLWQTIANKATDIKNAILKPFQDALSVLPGLLKSVGNAVISGVNTIIGGLENFINNIGGGINWLSDKLGNGKPIAHVSLPRIPALAVGTDSFSGGVALVGEEGPELVTLPKGTRVMPADQTKATVAAMHGAVPKFAGGIGGLFDALGQGVQNAVGTVSNAARSLSGVIGDVMNWISKGPDALVQAMLKALGINGLHLPGSTMNGVGGGIFNLMEKGADKFIGHILSVIQSVQGVGGVGTAAGLLPGYRLFNQLALTDVNKDMDCVPTSLASAASFLLGHMVSPVFLKDEVYGSGYLGGQSASKYVRAFHKLGLNLHSVGGGSGHLISDIHSFISSGIPVIATIPSAWNSNSGGSTHAIAFAGQTKGSLTAMNPWRGFWQAASDQWWMPRLRENQIWPVTKFGSGGVIGEPIYGVGLHSGGSYVLGERGPEYVTPGSSRNTMGIVVENHIYLDGRELGNLAGSQVVQRIRTVTQQKI